MRADRPVWDGRLWTEGLRIGAGCEAGYLARLGPGGKAPVGVDQQGGVPDVIELAGGAAGVAVQGEVVGGKGSNLSFRHV